MKTNYPRISTELDSTHHHKYVEAVERIMSHVLPPNFFEGEDVVERLEKQFPIVCWTPLKEPPFDLSFFLFCPYRANVFRFFYDRVSRGLIPDRRINALLQFAVDFFIPDLGPQKYVGGEVILRIESISDLDTLQKKLPFVENELRSGVESLYEAYRILEHSGQGINEKTALVQENLSLLIKRRPQDFDYDALSEMQHFLVLCKDEFKLTHSWRQMSRIICVHYLFRKALKHSLEVYPDKRFINVKLMRFKFQKKLGIAIGMSFLGENELLDSGHILRGIRSIISDAKLVEESFFCSQKPSDSCIMIYLEIEKTQNTSISLDEERFLRNALPQEIKNHIEQRLNPLFITQNEEMIMRHMLTLSGQLRYVRDLPQVIVEFSQQTKSKLEFLVVLARIAKPGLKPLSFFFESKPTFLEYFPDRTNIIGRLRKRHKKEASVFRVRIRKYAFLRKDQALDLNKARLQVTQELARIIGEFRDYNGGILSKEIELFEELANAVSLEEEEHLFFLENFFYSIQPPVMRSILPLEPLKKLFSLFLETNTEGLVGQEPYQIRMQYDVNDLYIIVSARDYEFQRALMTTLKLYAGRVATCFVKQTEHPIFGLIFRNPDEEEALRLRLSIEQTLAELYLKTYI